MCRLSITHQAARAVEEVLDQWWERFRELAVRQHSLPPADARSLPNPGANCDGVEAEATAGGPTGDRPLVSEVETEEVGGEDLAAGEKIKSHADIEVGKNHPQGGEGA